MGLDALPQAYEEGEGGTVSPPIFAQARILDRLCRHIRTNSSEKVQKFGPKIVSPNANGHKRLGALLTLSFSHWLSHCYLGN